MSSRNLILGGAQFGYQYGKYLPSTVSSVRDINELLDCALENDCSSIDIAQVYEGCVERLSSSNTINRFRISDKIVYNIDSEKETRKELLITLNKLRVEKYESVAIHNWSSLNMDGRRRALDFLNSLQSEQITSKKGISVYDSFEVKYSELHSHIDQIQAPLNFFKRDFLKHEDSFRLVNEGLQFHARSIFAQGTLISLSTKIKERFPEIEYFKDFKRNLEISSLRAALSIYDSQNVFSSLVVGVTNREEFLEIFNAEPLVLPYEQIENDVPGNLPISDPRIW
jgi:aryl-alcohol dehydrogenase-like predicted oxidoreductase